MTFAVPIGETISFEDVDDDVFKCEVGVNVFAFTETDAGIFIVNRKQIDIDQEVVFDPCGGTLDKTTLTFKLGAQYSSLPEPTMTGFSDELATSIFDGGGSGFERGFNIVRTHVENLTDFAVALVNCLGANKTALRQNSKRSVANLKALGGESQSSP